MLNIAYTHANVVLVIFYYYMLQNKQWILIMQNDVGVCVICIFNKVEYLDKKGSYINSTKEIL